VPTATNLSNLLSTGKNYRCFRLCQKNYTKVRRKRSRIIYKYTRITNRKDLQLCHFEWM